jgi:hypothetical protein
VRVLVTIIAPPAQKMRADEKFLKKFAFFHKKLRTF